MVAEHGQKWSIWGRYKLFIVAPGKMIVGSGFRCNSSQERAFFTLDGPTTFSVLGGDLVIGDNVLQLVALLSIAPTVLK